MLIFVNTSQFSFKFCINLECNQIELLCTFLALTLYNLVKSSPLKCKFLRLLSSQVKTRQIPCVNFETTSQSLFRFFIILACHYLERLSNFVAHAFSTLDKRIPWKYQFWHFQVHSWKFAKLLMSYSKPQVSFSSNFKWLFSVMKYTSL